MPPSALENFLRTERTQLLVELEPHRALARELDVFGQAVLGGWCEVAAGFRRAAHRAGELLAFYREQAEGYEPDDPDPDRLIVPIYFGATISGVADDIERGEARVAELSASLATLHEVLRTHGEGSSLYGAAVFAQVLSDLLGAGLEPGEAAPIGSLIFPWQRLAWLAECRLRRGAVLIPGRGEPLIGEAEEQLTYLMRLAANQPGLSNWPELARFVPRRAEGLLPLSEAAYRRFRQEGIPDDPALARRLVGEIVDQRHYALTAMSVIELEELGVKRIVLTPEERPESTVTGRQPAFMCGFLVDHVAGSFAGTATIGNEDTFAEAGRRASFLVPAILDRVAGELSSSDPEPSGDLSRDMTPVHEAQSAVELLVLAAWRDLVVPEVREQQYEVDRVRKAKGAGKRAAKRGRLEVIRYVPRRLVYRRAAREAAQREGRPEPRELYAVSAFARRLPNGQERSADAEAFAREIGIPLAGHQTVVRPHFRGGSAEERAAAMERGFGDQIRQWRSWSAIDLLRTRPHEPSHNEAAE